MSADTYFAPAARTDKDKLNEEIQIVSKNEVVDTLLKSVAGLIAVLDSNRQIISVNESFLKKMGIESFSEISGLRHGEAVNCVYSNVMEGGCGTSKHCSTCGAAIAITTCIAQNSVQERICTIKKKKDDKEVEICLMVRCSPLEIEDSKFFLLFLQDITKSYLNSHLESIFFHDIKNIITSLSGTSELLNLSMDNSDLVKDIIKLTNRLKNEVEVQGVISQTLSETYSINPAELNLNSFFAELTGNIRNSSISKNKIIEFEKVKDDIIFYSDESILYRIIENMIINALEASKDGDKVKIWSDIKNNTLVFYVWNKQYIPEKVQLRIFQRFYTTKGKKGRGLGTYSMKLLGEKFLNGKVGFESSIEKGTIFKLEINI